MKGLIGFCGLNCEKCEARKATLNDDEELRVRVAREWSELNHVTITPEMINCTGCRTPGAKTPYCEYLCPIRQCAAGKGIETCASCREMAECEKVGAILGNSEEARRNLNA